MNVRCDGSVNVTTLITANHGASSSIYIDLFFTNMLLSETPKVKGSNTLDGKHLNKAKNTLQIKDLKR